MSETPIDIRLLNIRDQILENLNPGEEDTYASVTLVSPTLEITVPTKLPLSATALEARRYTLKQPESASDLVRLSIAQRRQPLSGIDFYHNDSYQSDPQPRVSLFVGREHENYPNIQTTPLRRDQSEEPLYPGEMRIEDKLISAQAGIGGKKISIVRAVSGLWPPEDVLGFLKKEITYLEGQTEKINHLDREIRRQRRLMFNKMH